jgi:hypothetical protein
MHGWVAGVRTPVRRQGAEGSLLLMLLSFAVSVTLTRLFLELTGYPQLGTRVIHLAHLLWGGLLLFAAALLPLIYANRSVYGLAALLAGAGIGLFIDEVGKFITRANDYFYPPAAPIIYAFFLLTVLLYLQVRRRSPEDPRSAMYHALEALEEVLDHDLAPGERAALEARLRAVAAQDEQPQLAQLAQSLLGFVTSSALHLAPELPGALQRFLSRLEGLERRWLSRGRLRAVLAAGLAALGLWASLNLARLLAAAATPGGLEPLLARWLAGGTVASARGLNWFAARVALEGCVGLLLLGAALLFVLGRDRRAAGLGALALLLSLSTVNLLVFYFDQFSAIALVFAQGAGLLALLHYQRRHLAGELPDGAAAGGR